ncbi:InlB B-repeat-containing protein [Anaerostipes caccae]|uniref:InlB B-repeat-containing protein n=1 Tax=Anaerostipes caccae TaxID=105841 RepID=UPI0038D50D34
MAEKPVSEKKKAGTPKKQLAQNGQTLLDVSKGDIRITKNGATGGGLLEDETALNPKGYWIQGSTMANNIEVSKDVKTYITLDNVSITVGKADSTTSNWDCINVSHADVRITLIGENTLICNTGRSSDYVVPNTGCALAKDGMDGNLTIQCQNAEKQGHECNDSCGSLLAKGNPELWHVGAIGSTLRNRDTENGSGFSNLTIKGGNIEASAGGHTPGIGSACDSELFGGYTKNITITGGNIKATGTAFGSGIGSGYGNKVEGISISGGKVEAYGGKNSPGIGASARETSYGGQSEETKDVRISGGNTVVIAVGDEETGMPGIGSGAGKSKNSNITAAPDFGYQGYIQDGTSLEDYTFMEGTPFKEETDINIGSFYTKIYFGPFRDSNEIAKDTKEQLGANHVISKTGGDPFTGEQLKGLTRVTGKQENGTDFPREDITFDKPQQITKINEAKAAGRTGEYELTFTTPNGTKTTVMVYLKAAGTDASHIQPEQNEPAIGADDFQQDTGGGTFSEDDVRNLAAVQGKDSDGTTYPLNDFSVDTEQLAALNEAKTSGKGGGFPLTFTSPDNKTAVIRVTLIAYDQTASDEITGETIKGLNIISATGGKAFTEDELKELSKVTATDGRGDPISSNELSFPERGQLEALKQAKTGGKTGDYPLTIAAPDGTTITIYVYLRENASAQTADGKKQGSIGADNYIQATGGKAFTEEEIVELCGAKGKDAYGNNAAVNAEKKQLEALNSAKTFGRTGSFKLGFLLEDGTRTEVTVTLTGDHTVTFDPDGGDYQPKDQTVVGGRTAVEPKEPKKEGYIFEGWYFTDETGKEVKWDFDTPVHQSMVLKTKWKQKPETANTDKKKEDKTKSDTNSKDDDESWNYKEVSSQKKDTRAARTEDKFKLPWIFGCMAGAAGFAVCFYKRNKLK